MRTLLQGLLVAVLVLSRVAAQTSAAPLTGGVIHLHDPGIWDTSGDDLCKSIKNACNLLTNYQGGVIYGSDLRFESARSASPLAKS